MRLTAFAAAFGLVFAAFAASTASAQERTDLEALLPGATAPEQGLALLVHYDADGTPSTPIVGDTFWEVWDYGAGPSLSARAHFPDLRSAERPAVFRAVIEERAEGHVMLLWHPNMPDWSEELDAAPTLSRIEDGVPISRVADTTAVEGGFVLELTADGYAGVPEMLTSTDWYALTFDAPDGGHTVLAFQKSDETDEAVSEIVEAWTATEATEADANAWPLVDHAEIIVPGESGERVIEGTVIWSNAHFFMFVAVQASIWLPDLDLGMRLQVQPSWGEPSVSLWLEPGASARRGFIPPPANVGGQTGGQSAIIAPVPVGTRFIAADETITLVESSQFIPLMWGAVGGGAVYDDPVGVDFNNAFAVANAIELDFRHLDGGIATLRIEINGPRSRHVAESIDLR